MKEQYTQPVADIVSLMAEDIITSSIGLGDDQHDSIYKIKGVLDV